MPGKIAGATCKVAGEIKIQVSSFLAVTTALMLLFIWALEYKICSLQTHIYENGNVQLLSSKKFEFDVTASSPKSLGQEICTKITESDSKYQVTKSLSLQCSPSVLIIGLIFYEFATLQVYYVCFFLNCYALVCITAESSMNASA